MKKIISVGVSVILMIAFVLTLYACVPENNQPVNLAMPTDVTVENNVLKWNSVEGASKYVVFINNREFDCNETRYDLSQIEDLVVGKDYEVRVKAIGGKGDSDYSEPIKFTYNVKIPGSDQLKSPLNLRIEEESTIRWNPVDGAVNYTISIDGNEYICERESYDMNSYAYLVNGETLSVKVKANGNGAKKNSNYSEPIDYVYRFEVSVEKEDVISNSRYQAVAAPKKDNLPIIVESVTDCTYNYYVLDVGYVKNVPISSGSTFYYGGITPMSVSFQQSDVTERNVEESLSKTVSETISETVMNEAGGSITIGTGDFLSAFVKGEIEGHYSRTWGSATEKMNSMTNTFTTAQTTARSITESISFTVGEHHEARGDYRLSLFAVCDVYYVLKTNRENTKIIECKTEICARPNTQKFALDYAKDGNFDKSDDTGFLERVLDHFINFPIPNFSNFTVELDMQGGSGSSKSVEATYGKSLPRSAAPTRDGFLFVGFYSEKDGKGEQWYDLNMNGTRKWDVFGGGKLYAYYTRSKVTLLRNLDYTKDGGVQDDYGFDKPIRTQLDTNYPSTVYFGFRNNLASGLDVALLAKCGLNHAKVTIRYYMREIDDGYQEVGLQYWNEKWITFSENKKQEHGSGYKNTDWGWETYTAPTIDLALISSELRVRFGANGKGFNDWIFHKVEVTIEAIA